MSGCEGYFESIELSRVDINDDLTADLIIYNGQTSIGEPRYTQTVTIPQGTGTFTITLAGGTGDLSFFEDSQYTFMLSHPDLQLQGAIDVDLYTEGQLFVEVGFVNADDLWFKLNVVPTLGVDSIHHNDVILYPNPAHSNLQLSGLEAPQNFAIYTILGVQVMQGIAQEDQAIDVNQLANGLYIFKLDDKKTFRFLKH